MTSIRTLLTDVGELPGNSPKCALVSIVIPMHNHEKFVVDCLDSAYVDDYPNIEVLILDDGSTDRSTSMVRDWRATHRGRFRKFWLGTRENSGITKTLNQLVDMASGDFIAPIASDDFFLSGGIRRRVELMDRHPEWLALFADCIGVNGVGQKIMDSVIRERFNGDPNALNCSRTLAVELLLNWCVPGPVFMARRTLYSDAYGVGKYNDRLIVEDRDLMLRAAARAALGFIDCRVAGYRMHSASATQSNATKLRIKREIVFSTTVNAARFHGPVGFIARVAAEREKTNFEWSKPNRTVSIALRRYLYGITAKLILGTARLSARMARNVEIQEVDQVA
jgi:glycosyltransferase involved in cell wall biosynthesis